jgi:hypothetical protein
MVVGWLINPHITMLPKATLQTLQERSVDMAAQPIVLHRLWRGKLTIARAVGIFHTAFLYQGQVYEFDSQGIHIVTLEEFAGQQTVWYQPVSNAHSHIDSHVAQIHQGIISPNYHLLYNNCEQWVYRQVQETPQMMSQVVAWATVIVIASLVVFIVSRKPFQKAI